MNSLTLSELIDGSDEQDLDKKNPFNSNELLKCVLSIYL